jgi:hypothetical protein
LLFLAPPYGLRALVSPLEEELLPLPLMLLLMPLLSDRRL